jgi:hypothetical protein
VSPRTVAAQWHAPTHLPSAPPERRPIGHTVPPGLLTIDLSQLTEPLRPFLAENLLQSLARLSYTYTVGSLYRPALSAPWPESWLRLHELSPMLATSGSRCTFQEYLRARAAGKATPITRATLRALFCLLADVQLWWRRNGL